MGRRELTQVVAGERFANSRQRHYPPIGRGGPAARIGHHARAGPVQGVEKPAGKGKAWKKSKSKVEAKPNNEDPQRQSGGTVKKGCQYCGSQKQHVHKDCPAREKECFSCGKLGHFAKVCRSARDKSAVSGIQRDWPPAQLELVAPHDCKPVAVIATEEAASLLALPDPGAEIDAVPEIFFRRENSPGSTSSAAPQQ